MSGIVRRLAVAVVLTVALAGRATAQDHAHAGHQASPNAEVASVIQAIQALFAAAERGDLAALDSIYAGDSLLVIEGSGINRGWTDYRDNHLAPELKEFSNFRATFRYALSADLPTGKADVVGRGTAILERRGARWVVRLTHTASRARRPSDPPMP